jgi:hypothetical protein
VTEVTPSILRQNHHVDNPAGTQLAAFDLQSTFLDSDLPENPISIACNPDRRRKSAPLADGIVNELPLPPRSTLVGSLIAICLNNEVGDGILVLPPRPTHFQPYGLSRCIALP